MAFNHTNAIEEANELAVYDELVDLRNQFHIPKRKDGTECIYLCGNSLGLQPKMARTYVEEVMNDWEKYGVDGHTHANRPWMPYHEILTDQMSKVVGAIRNEVVVMNSLTVNLHLLMVSFYRPTKERYKIIIEKGAFPSDRYAMCSQISFHGFDVQEALIELSPREGEYVLRHEDILQAIKDNGAQLALVLIGNVNYYTGQAFDMKAISQAAHNVGSMVSFDLAHGAGNIICDLHDSDVDFAMWCSYKYLNSGPGALSGVFINDKYANDPDLPRFLGWWGHDKTNRFKMEPEFQLIPGAEGWQLSNPPILPMACMKASLDLFERAGMPALRNKSVLMTTFLLRLLNNIESDRITVITPENPNERGGQLSLKVKDANKQLFSDLTSQGVVADWREPDVIRIACAPLYNTFGELAQFASILNQLITK